MKGPIFQISQLSRFLSKISNQPKINSLSCRNHNSSNKIQVFHLLLNCIQHKYKYKHSLRLIILNNYLNYNNISNNNHQFNSLFKISFSVLSKHNSNLCFNKHNLHTNNFPTRNSQACNRVFPSNNNYSNHNNNNKSIIHLNQITNRINNHR